MELGSVPARTAFRLRTLSTISIFAINDRRPLVFRAHRNMLALVLALESQGG